jgi:predicted N-acetyltransferase YhbS
LIRPAVDADLPALRAVAEAALDLEPGDRGQLVDLLHDRGDGTPVVRLAAEEDGRVVGFAFGSIRGARGFVDGWAVEPASRHRGVGSELLRACESALVAAGASSLSIGGNTWCYAWPGLDPGYTAALVLLERRGYSRTDTLLNMDVPLSAWQQGLAPDAWRDRGSGVELRRATGADAEALVGFARGFSGAWADESARAVHRDRPTAFLALREGRVVGFACHGVYRDGWFGPTGVDPAERGNGLGEALLRLCLDDLAAAGTEVAQISWIGPMAFYHRTVGARCRRVFLTLEKAVPVEKS